MNTTTTNPTCANCNKAFNIIPQEAAFLQRQNLPTPIHCPACRHKMRMALRSERALYKRTCEKCQQNCLSTIPETAPYKIVCHSCFWENIG